MYTMYGYQVNPESDSFVKTAEEAVEMLINSMSPGAQIANNLTFRESTHIFTQKAPHLNARRSALSSHVGSGGRVQAICQQV